jgi:hypothetical protein
MQIGARGIEYMRITFIIHNYDVEKQIFNLKRANFHFILNNFQNQNIIL